MSDLTGPQKAAIVLISLGEEFAGKVFKRVDEEEVRELGRQMSLIRNISASVVEETFEEFNQLLGSELDLVVKGDEFVKRALTTALPDQADALLEDLEEARLPEPFVKLKATDPRVLGNFLKSEHPQTIAVILAHLDPPKAADVIATFPETLQYEVVMRIGTLEQVPPQVIHEIDQVLGEEVISVGETAGRTVGGIQAVAELLNHVDKSTEEMLLERLEEYKSEMADEVRQLMFVFEDINSIEDRGIRTILKEVSNEDLTMALKTASEELKAKILGNISERAAAMIQEDLEVMGPVRLSDVERAQQNITRVARRLEKEGKIVIGGGGTGGDVFV
ncbi:MAG: flagellar motor switch protein FliG [Deltaproteobacteria bacterium]|nr:flagellar motor switch protein FliG [Deltaproteobacteria bacterium]